ncbi:MAG: hypothetical protein Kow00109_13660 [Acidobacteriota bacterium]
MQRRGAVPVSKTNRPARVGLLLVVPVGALVWNWRLFQAGFPIAGDNPSHFAEICALAEVVLPEQGWWAGWFEGDFFGYPLPAYQYPLGKWLAALLGWILPGGHELAYKLALVLAWIFPAWVLARRFSRYNLRLGALLALLYFAAQDQLYFALAGMWNVFLALGFALLSYDELAGGGEDNGRTSLASLWMGLAAVAHPFSLALVGPAVAAWAWRTSRLGVRAAVFRLVALAVPAVLLTSWYWLPWLQTAAWPAVVPKRWDWNAFSPVFPLTATEVAGPRPAVGQLVHSWLWDSGGMIAAWLLAATAAVGLRPDRRLVPPGPPAHLALATLGLFLAASSFLILAPPAPTADVASLVRIGRLSPVLLVLLLWTAGELLPGTRFRHPRRLAVIGLPALLTLGLNLSTAGLHHRELYETFSPDRPRHPQELALAQIWEHLREHPLPTSEGRLLLQDTLYNLSDGPFRRSHVLALTWRYTGRWTLGAFCEAFAPTTELSRSEGGWLLGRRIEQWDPVELAAALAAFGVTEVLACEPRVQALLADTPGFQEAFEAGPFRLFRATGRSEGLVRNTGLTLRISTWTHSRRVFHIAAPEPKGPPPAIAADGHRVTILSNYHPWWTAQAGAETIPVLPGSRPGSLDLLVPSTADEVSLQFRPPRRLPAALTLLGVVLLLVPGVAPGRRRADLKAKGGDGKP